ncbi:MAG: aminotransferase class I/II-fold pyridoxal phosphate-dependent enzyme [Spirochaetes bacterium]|nr:aminotransferase class I/II-fold pyridoxal phosphate-dependent enzyme [Spirochaetota bacterium]
MKTIDLRSDTITVPDEGMRKAMYDAEVGDDVYGEDVTVNELQDLASSLTGKQASLFISSGSMGNLIPQFIIPERGSEVIAHRDSHIFHYELSSMAAVAGLMPRPVDGKDGKLTLESVKNAMRPEIYYMPKTGLIEIENTHNAAGGTFYTTEELKALHGFSLSIDVPIHMDGARVFNASATSGVSVKDIASCCETITFCLSKGLGAPAGSMLCGTAEFIAEAKRVRKMFGGGMRQIGILAAAGIYALKNNVSKLEADHIHARMIADAIRKSEILTLVNENISTNIVYFTAAEGCSLKTAAEKFHENGILISGDSSVFRIVTHLDVSQEDIERVCRFIENLKIY